MANSAKGRRASTRATILLLLGAILLPNVAFFALSAVLALPHRLCAICLYAAVALLCGRARTGVVVGLWLAALVCDVFLLVTSMFVLDLAAVAGWLRMLPHLDLLASHFYAAMLAGLAAVTMLNLSFLCWSGPAMARGSRAALSAALVLIAAADVARAGGALPDFARWTGSEPMFESGVEQSGFVEVVREPDTRRHVLLVLVESFGRLRDPDHHALLMAPFADAALRRGFAVRTGTTAFAGSTAQGEMRELCLTREPYRALLTGARPSCLPAAFAARGFRTVSVHGFSKAFYERSAWYPLIGFMRSEFQESLQLTRARRCGSTFAGPCDVDLAEMIRVRMRSAAEPVFVYWLTLNSHVPVKPGQATRRFDCETGGPFGDAEVCSMAEIWIDLFEAVKRIAADLPQAEILLVGDHAPPLWRRSARELFEPDRVPWIRLSPRPGGALTAQADP